MKILENFKHFIVASHDAGGANVLIALIEKLRISDRCFFIIDGPASVIFAKRIKELKRISLEDIYSFDSDETLILTSTSLEAELERTVLSSAKAHHFKTMAIVDHWTNYIIRFVPNSLREKAEEVFLSLLPDYIVLTDQKAYSIAVASSFPNERLVLIDNPYFESLKHQYCNISKNITQCNRILYMSEYFSSRGNIKLTELDYLRSILIQFKKLKIQELHLEFYMRLHPSESIDKYNSLLNDFPFLKIGLKNSDLLEDLARSKIVIGKSSMGLVVSAMLGIPTFSYRHPDFDFITLDERIVVIDSVDKSLLDTACGS